ncbi:DUF6493 family protein [Sabulibacter ruber]|uniref:DUF6493 family protein n=1 Tax=Sabulibacter ruber TaxID=2811901 RepID=UPI001A969C26|nr:DUF6493 family protein [Sabulibacter ruber]
MTLIEQYSKLLEKSRRQEAIGFLKSLDNKQKKEIAPALKKLAKEYLENHWVTTGNTTRSHQKATDLQRDMLLQAYFVCMNRAEYSKLIYSSWILGNGLLGEILEWYCPTWFSDYLNSFADNEWVPVGLTYQWVIELQHKGFVSPSPELWVKILPNLVYESTSNHRWLFKPENLLQWPETLSEHVWYFFEWDSNVHFSNRYLSFKEPAVKEKAGWIDVFKMYVDQGQLDRKRVLQSAVQATTRNFNKNLSGWFADLFQKLEPTSAELLEIQESLFNALNSAHSKPVNTVLSYFKKLADDKEFKADDFLDHVPLLLSSETKTTVTSALMVLEKLARKRPALRGRICEVALQALVHADDALQTRAAKLVQKFGDPSLAELQQALTLYQDNLFSSARTLLQAFVPVSDISQEETISHEIDLANYRLSPENEIPKIETVEDLVFLSSQAFDNNEPYHIDLLPAALIQLQDQLKGEKLNALQPAFQRAYHLLLNLGQGGTGYLDNLLATFFVDYARFLFKKYPAHTADICAIHDSYVKKDKETLSSWLTQERIGSLDNWKTHHNDVVYEPFKLVLKVALEKLKQEDQLPLLSTPTHSPGWVSPLELVKRLQQYQSCNQLPDALDLQVAISRCALEQSDEALHYAKTHLTGEYLRLLQFLLQKEAQPEGPYKLKGAWMVAGLTKSPLIKFPAFEDFPFTHLSRTVLTGQYTWRTSVEGYTYSAYDHQTKKMVKIPGVHKVLKLDLYQKPLGKLESGFKSFVAKLLPLGKEKEEKLFLYDYIKLKRGLPWNGHHDLKRLLYLVPNNPEPLLGQITARCLNYSTFSEENEKTVVRLTLETLLGMWRDMGAMAHLFLATSMLSSDKTVRAYAAEIWVNQVSQKDIDSGLLGEIIGIQERIEFAPLKRFTDLVISNMYQISDQHNRALETLLQCLLSQLPDEPIKNLKALLQIYTEVLALNNSTVKDEVLLERLAIWKKTNSLKKLTERLEVVG